MPCSGVFNIRLPDGTTFLLQTRDSNKIRISNTGWHTTRAEAKPNQEVTDLFIIKDDEYYNTQADIEQRRASCREAYDRLVGILCKVQDDRSQSN